METLVRRRVLRTVGDRLEFVHDRIRDVAFKADLLPLRRAVLHRRLAESMEALYATDLDPYCLAIGTHYAEGEVWAKAVPFLRRAGTAAADRSAYREAAASFERALAALEHCPPERATTEQAIDLRLDLARAYLPLGRHRERLALVEEAERLAVAIGDPTRLGWAHRGMAGVLYNLRQFDRAIAYGERALAAAEAARRPSPEDQCELCAGPHSPRGRSQRPGDRPLPGGDDPHRRRRRHRPRDAWLVRAPPPRRPGLAGAGAGGGRSVSGGPGSRRGGPPPRRRHPAARRPPGPALPRAGPLPPGRHGGGAAPLRAGAWRSPRPRTTRSWLAAAYAGLGRTLARSGRGEEAIGLLERSVAMERAGTGVAPANRIRQLGRGVSGGGPRGRGARAGAGRAGGAGAPRRASGGDAARAFALVGAALAAREPPDLAGAEAHYREALELATPLGLAPLVACCHLGLGQVDRRRGRRSSGAGAPGHALAALKRMGMTLWAEQAEREQEALANG